MKIHKDLTIGEVLKEVPQAADIMAKHGLHCATCSVNVFETIEMGAKGHGLDDAEITTIINEINEAAATKSQKDIVITELAAKKTLELMKSEGKEDYGLRIEVVSGGCSGSQYFIDFDNQPMEDDQVMEINGIKLIVSKDSIDVLKGSIIDYSDSGYKIDNPNFQRSSGCNCGNSAE